MQIHHLRHATFILHYAGQRFLVDPMLSPKGAMETIRNAANDQRIPLVDLPLNEDQLQNELQACTAVLLTHTHRDHWDNAAMQQLARDKPILCQPADLKTLQEAGFGAARAVRGRLLWQGIQIQRTGGRHGRGATGKLMGTVCGFVLQAEGEPSLYIAGDTIWCAAVQKALNAYHPAVIVLNAGEARFLQGGPITMSAAHVRQVCVAAPQAQIVAVHLEAVNHCALSRAALRSNLLENGLSARVSIPEDGERLLFS